MVAIFCKLCLAHIEVTDWAAHITEKRHKNNLPSKIIVEGNFQHGDIEGVHQYFAQFGKITDKTVLNDAMGKNSIQYLFEDPCVYSVIVHKQHMLLGKLLTVSWVKMVNFDKGKNDSDMDLDTDDEEDQRCPVHKGDNSEPCSPQSIDTLFADRKISFSDYLAIKHRHEVEAPNPLDPVETQQKNQTLLLCKRALGAMSHRTPKRIRPRQLQPPPKPPRLSPLLKSVVKFRLTSRKEGSNGSFSLALYSVLRSIGVASKETDVDRLMNSLADSLCSGKPVDKTVTAKILQVSLLGSTSRNRNRKRDVATQCL